MDGFLTRSLATLREVTDEPEISAKFGESRLIVYLESAYQHVLAELNRNTRHPITAQFDVTMLAPTVERYYPLPPTLKAVERIDVVSSAGDVLYTVVPRDKYHLWGPTFTLEGSMLRVRRDEFGEGEILRLHYIPSGTAKLFEGPCTLNAAGTIATVGAPTKGERDLRPHAYLGSTFRILSATTNGYVQERPITAYAVATGAFTLASALDPIPATSIVCEVAPPLDSTLDIVVSLDAAMTILGIEKNTSGQKALLVPYTKHMRDIRLDASRKNLAMDRFGVTRNVYR